MTDPDGLPRLEAELARDFARLNHPPAEWAPERHGPDGRPMADMLIVGGGMCGLAAAFALRRLGIARIRQIDRRAAGAEGPWLSYARMRTLRSPKHLTGPAQGIANLTFRAWFEAAHGAEAWEPLGRIPREMWAHYLGWFRHASGAQVENDIALCDLVPEAGRVRAELSTGETLFARQVVLATGREGQARPRVPRVFAPFFGDRVLHSSHDLPAMGGKRVAVIGLAASAFDNAAAALEAGAAKVSLIGRAPEVPRLNKMKQTVYPGFTLGFPALPDTEKLALLRHVMAARIAPPRDSVLRVSSDPRLRLLLGREVRAVEEIEGALTLDTGMERIVCDLAILGTGFALDLEATPELAGFAGQILRWSDRVTESRDDEWGAAPYLDAGFAFQPRESGAVWGLERVRCFTHAAQLSLGNLANDIPAVGDGAQRLAERAARDLFIEDSDHHRARLHAYEEPELLGDEWPQG